MTDITELAQRVKTESAAIEDTQWYLAKPSEIRLLVEALEKAQQYAKERDKENQDLMLTVGRLCVQREGLEANLVDCGCLDDGVEEGYLKWVEDTCRAAMLAVTPREVK